MNGLKGNPDKWTERHFLLHEDDEKVGFSFYHDAQTWT